MPDPRDAPPGWRMPRAALAGLTRLGVLVALLSVASLLPLHPLSMLEHFRLQLLLGSAAIAGLAALLGLRGWFDVAALCALLDLLLVAPALAGSPRPAPRDGVPVRLLLANVLTSNPHHELVARAITELQPDLVALVETDARWVAALEPALTGYPGRISIAHPGNFGLALFARGELRGGVEYLGSALPSLVAEVRLGNGAAPLSLLLTHPHPPMNRETAAGQRQQLAAVARRARELTAPVILAGDFNATPWSAVFARLVDETGLYDSRAGFGVQASYPSSPNLALLRIPIDHVLLSETLSVTARRIERDLGSDHLPVFLELIAPR